MADAVGITPKFVPTDELRPRDNSGGGKTMGFAGEIYSAEYGDGPHTTGAKSSLSAGKGGSKRSRKREDDNDGDEY